MNELIPESERFRQYLSESAPDQIHVAGGFLKIGSRVTLNPKSGDHTNDASLNGRAAVIEYFVENDRGKIFAAVTVRDPGIDLMLHPSHLFFFAPEELVPVYEEKHPGHARVLVAGLGNTFFGGDGFGVAVAQRLALSCDNPDIEIKDFGIRSLELAHALNQGYEAAVLIDIVKPVGYPGRLTIVEPDTGDENDGIIFDNHHFDLQAVIKLAKDQGTLPGKILLVGCESCNGDVPLSIALSPEVDAAVDNAAKKIMELLRQLISKNTGHKTADSNSFI